MMRTRITQERATLAIEAGQQLLHYRLTEKIGEGGMGEVYLAQDTKLGREVAIKVLPASMAQDESRVLRFEREARAVAALNHPNIVGIYAVEHTEAGQGVSGVLHRLPVRLAAHHYADQGVLARHLDFLFLPFFPRPRDSDEAIGPGRSAGGRKRFFTLP